ncbi:LAME_0H14312g1_1 [Lachancea meyersii CBS 8951]|uniref:LAME_0H14312g1_1 n=1 Tax=Lachancea meyersii CBS 8951 TaxID=1266667 RepID=A0A1G4KH90_9SACH|nr:LAME_0H14312g1_1 [Lachancea meyersii CBS 8951]
MTAENERRPLGTVSKSRMNQLNGLTTTDMPTKSSSLKLPSITSIICEDSERCNERQTRDRNVQGVDLDEVTRKLKIRMQMAYYKLQTKQTRLRFRQVVHAKAKLGPAPEGLDETLNANEKTASFPVTAMALSPSARHPHGIGKPTRRLVMSQGSLRTPVKPCLWNSNNSMAAAGGRTPLHTFDSNQATPMSVKAAKSLIDLFTSNQ